MKVISLNTWGARAGKEPILEFFRKHKDIDIFCLQEIWEGGDHVAPKFSEGIDTKMLTNIQGILTDHIMFFRPHVDDYYGLAIFVSKKLKVLEEGDVFVYQDRGWVHEELLGNHARNLQYITIETSLGPRTVLNFHGLWNGQGKTDTPERMEQADRINKFINSLDNPHVLCGDFNLLPENESLKNIEAQGLRNLIREFGITSTRSIHYKKPEKFADYTLVSDGIKVNDFKMLPDEISDHLAMYLDFE